MEHINLLEEILSYIINPVSDMSDRIEVFMELDQRMVLYNIRTVHKIIYRIISHTVKKIVVIPSVSDFEVLLLNNVDRYVSSPEIDINDIVTKEGYPLDLNNPSDVKLAKDGLFAAAMYKFKELASNNVKRGLAVASINSLSDSFQRDRIEFALSKAYRVYTEGDYVGKDKLAGLDVVDYVIKEFMDIANTYNDVIQKSKTTVLDENFLVTSRVTSDKNRPRKLFSYGLSPIDEAFGEFKTGHTLAINGQEGVGKTRYAISRIIDCVINTKETIYFYCGEQDENTLVQMLTCCYAFTQERYIEDSRVRDGDLSEDERVFYENIKAQLLTREDYGNIILVTGGMQAKDIASHIEHAHRFIRPLGMVVIDHMGLLQTEFRENQELQETYQRLHSFGKNNNIGMVLLNHLNDDEVNRLVEGKDARTTGGAKTRESTRTPDYIITMSQSQKQKEVNKVNFQTPKARLGRSFTGFLADVSFGVSYFSYTE